MYSKKKDDKWVFIGDVIKDLQLPNLKNEDFKLVSKNPKSPNYSVRQYYDTKYFVFLSHECDFNDDKRTFYLIAPFCNINQNLRKETVEFEKFKNSNNVYEHPHYLNCFYYENHQILESDLYIDFTRMLHVSASIKSDILANKCLELTKHYR